MGLRHKCSLTVGQSEKQTGRKMPNVFTPSFGLIHSALSREDRTAQTAAHLLVLFKPKTHFNSIVKAFFFQKSSKVKTKRETARLESDVCRWGVETYPKSPCAGIVGLFVGNLLAQFKDQSLETLWLKMTAV